MGRRTVPDTTVREAFTCNQVSKNTSVRKARDAARTQRPRARAAHARLRKDVADVGFTVACLALMYFIEAWEPMGDVNQRGHRRRKGLANYRLVR